jgi:hypothetical protein
MTKRTTRNTSPTNVGTPILCRQRAALGGTECPYRDTLVLGLASSLAILRCFPGISEV